MGKIIKNGIEYGGAPLPIASANVLGGVKVGSGLSIDPDGTLKTTGGGGGASSLNDLSDVENIQPAQNELLMYDDEISKYVNTMMTLNKISGVRVTPGTLADGDVLTYDSQTGRFVNKPASGGGGGGNATISHSTAYESRTWPADDPNPSKKYIRFTVPGHFEMTDEQYYIMAIQSTVFYVVDPSTYEEISWTHMGCGIGATTTPNYVVYKYKSSQSGKEYEIGIKMLPSNIIYDSVNDVSYFDFDLMNTDIKNVTDNVDIQIDHMGLNLGFYYSTLTVIGQTS